MDINKIILSPFEYFLIYLSLINLFGLLIMVIDKWKSKRRGRRIPEKTIFTIAFLGGSIGVYLGMKLFHHKTLHAKFKFGIPAIFLLHTVIYIYIYYKFY